MIHRIIFFVFFGLVSLASSKERPVISLKEVLIISTPNIENIFYPFWAEPTHIRPYAMDSLVSVIESEGFKIVEKKKTHPLKHPFKILFLKALGISHYAKLLVVAEH